MAIDATFEDIVRTNAFPGAWTNMLRPSIVRAGLDQDNLKPAGRIDVTDHTHVSNHAWDIWSAGYGVGLVTREQSMAGAVDDLAHGFRRQRRAGGAVGMDRS